MNTRTNRLLTIAPYLVLALAFVWLVARARYSFCWVDEGFYLSLADQLHRGAAPFVDEWHPAQIYAPLLLPFYELWLHVNGSTDGIALFFRYCYLLISFFVSLAAYKVLSRDFNPAPCLAIALSYLFYIRANIQGMSYYSLCTTFVLLGLLCAWCTWCGAQEDDGSASWGRILRPLFAGVFFALAIVCNPYVIVAFFIACLVGLVLALKRRQGRIFTPFAWAICGAVVVAALYLMFLLGRAPLSEVVSHLGVVLSSHDENLTFAQRIPNYLGYLPVSRIGFLGTAALTVFMIVWRAMRRPVTPQLRAVVIVADTLLLAATLYVACTASLHPNKAFLAFVEFAVPAYLLSSDLHLRAHPEVPLFWLPGILMSVIWQYSSNTQICAILIGYSIAFMGAAITVWNVLEENAGGSAALARVCRIAGLLGLVAVLCITVAIRVTSIYSDDAASKLNVELTAGPASGLLTTAEHAREYDGAMDLLNRIDSDGGVWLTPMIPWGYLEVPGSCAAVSTWNTFMSAEDAAVYYGEDGHELPQWIVVTNDDLGESVNIILGKKHLFPALRVYEDYNAQLRADLEASTEYGAIYTTDFGTVYKRADAPSFIG